MEQKEMRFSSRYKHRLSSRTFFAVQNRLPEIRRVLELRLRSEKERPLPLSYKDDRIRKLVERTKRQRIRELEQRIKYVDGLCLIHHRELC